MLLPVRHCRCVVRVGVAVVAEVRAGVVFTDVLRDHALTERSLPLIFLMLTDKVMVMRQEDSSFW